MLKLQAERLTIIATNKIKRTIKSLQNNKIFKAASEKCQR